MIRSFKGQGTEDLFNRIDSKAARRACPHEIRRVAQRKLDQLDSVSALAQLAIPPRDQLEALQRDRKGQHSIRINDQYRVCFTWTDGAADAVEIVDDH